MTTITVSVCFDPVNPETSDIFVKLLSSLGLPTVVAETLAKPRKVRPPLTDAQKKIVRERFAAGRAKAQAKRDAEAAKAKPANDKPVVKLGVRPQPAPKK
jgi:hypothetical protein